MEEAPENDKESSNSAHANGMKNEWGNGMSGGIAPPILNPDTRERSVVNLTPCPLCLRERTIQFSLKGGWVPRTYLNILHKKQNFAPLLLRNFYLLFGRCDTGEPYHIQPYVAHKK